MLKNIMCEFYKTFFLRLLLLTIKLLNKFIANIYCTYIRTWNYSKKIRVNKNLNQLIKLHYQFQTFYVNNGFSQKVAK